MRKIIVADKNLHASEMREFFQEYLQWASKGVFEEFGVRFDTEELTESTMQHVDWYMAPKGRVVLGYADEKLAGIACLKELAPQIGEIKRMYVRPATRKQGLGRALLERLLAEAGQIGYKRVRLDSARFMQAAHALYRSAGFHDIDAYEGSEIPPEFRKHWVFMEKELEPDAVHFT